MGLNPAIDENRHGDSLYGRRVQSGQQAKRTSEYSKCVFGEKESDQ